MPFESITRLKLRGSISELAGDNYGTGTATSGSTTTLVDTNGIHAPSNDDYKGVWAYINEGAAVGRESFCSASVASSSTLTLVTGTAINATSEYELHRRWRVRQWNDSIDRALRASRAMQTNPIQDRTLVVSTEGTREYPLPDGIHTIHEISYLPSGDTTKNEVSIPFEDWEVSIGSTGAITRLLRFNGGVLPANDSTIVLRGTEFPSVPTSDSSILQINVELITLHVLWQYAVRFKDRLSAARARDDYNLLLSETSSQVPGNSRIVETV